MIAIIINLVGIGFVALIIWWFLIAKPRETTATGDLIDIVVQNGVYEPALIRAKVGQTLQLRFLRKDKSACSEFVIFDKLNVSAKLPIDEYHIIKLTLSESGDFEFTCQMGMYRGKLKVE